MNSVTVVLLCESVRTVISCVQQRVFLHLVEFEGLSEIVNSMRLKSALEDFEANTLGAIRGLLGRFSYVGRLHDGNGTYEHWVWRRCMAGMLHNAPSVRRNRGLLSEVLKKPLAVLLNDVRAFHARAST